MTILEALQKTTQEIREWAESKFFNKANIDTALSDTSENPVQNKVINAEITNINTLANTAIENAATAQFTADENAKKLITLKAEDVTLPTSTKWNSVTYVNGKFMALPDSSDIAAYSEDGITWTPIQLPASASWESVAYGNGKFVAVANRNKTYAYSEDGITWTPSQLSTNSVWHVAYGNGKFVAVPQSATYVRYSEDGITWTSTLVETTFSGSAVTYGNGKFVVTSFTSGNTIYSEDGITWMAATSTQREWQSVTYGNGKFVTVARNTNIAAYSTDGIAWTETSLPTTARWYSVTYGNGKFVAVAQNSDKAAYSEDGVTWTETTLPISASWRSVDYGNGKFVAVANDSNIVAYSEDGINWRIDYEILAQNDVDLTEDIRELVLGDSVVYAEEDSTETGAVPLNADTLGGRLSAEFALAENLAFTADSLQSQIDSKAPAGFGLGEVPDGHIQATPSNIDTILAPGWYNYYDNTFEALGSLSFAGGIMVIPRHVGVFQIFYPRGSIKLYGSYAIREYDGTTWSEWSIENPPMAMGVEYRTTERWNGKPVYTRLIDCGSMPAAGNSKWVAFGYGTGITKVLRVSGQCSGGATLPYYEESLELRVSGSYTPATDQAWVCVSVIKGDFTTQTSVVQVWYVKE